MSKILIILSGGMDSTTLLYYVFLNKQGTFDDIHTLYVDYGQSSMAHEVYAFNEINNMCGMPKEKKHMITIDPDIFHPIEKVNISNVSEKTQQVVNQTTYPLRNMILCSIAASIVIQNKLDTIAIGALNSMYADCKPDFLKSLEETINKGSPQNNGVKIYAPFTSLNKSHIVILGKSLGVDFGLTYSCYYPPADPHVILPSDLIHCGQCPACIERKTAFKNCNIEDPTVYVN